MPLIDKIRENAKYIYVDRRIKDIEEAASGIARSFVLTFRYDLLLVLFENLCEIIESLMIENRIRDRENYDWSEGIKYSESTKKIIELALQTALQFFDIDWYLNTAKKHGWMNLTGEELCDVIDEAARIYALTGDEEQHQLFLDGWRIIDTDFDIFFCHTGGITLGSFLKDKEYTIKRGLKNWNGFDYSGDEEQD